MTTHDPWRPLQAGEHPVFREDYSLTLLADGPTPWGYLRVVPTMTDDERRVDWRLDDTTIATLRMTNLKFGRRTLSKADYPVIIDPEHAAALDIGDQTGTTTLVEGTRTGLLRRRSAHIHITIGHHEWSTSLHKTWYQLHPFPQPKQEPQVRIRDHAIQDANRPARDRAADDHWRSCHLLTWTDGATIAQLATAHLLRAGTNWAYIGSSFAAASHDSARKMHFENYNHLLDEPGER